jgi:hypothetical protein
VASSPIADVEVRKNGRKAARRARAGARPVQLRTRPPARRKRRRRAWRSTIAAIVATGAYAAAVVAAYQLVVPVLRDGDAPDAPVVEPSAEAATRPAAPSAAGRDLLALRTLASRAQRSVFRIEGAGVLGSGFVAWQIGGKSYLITSRTLVAGVLRDGGNTVFVRRGTSFWEADIAREDAGSGLALLRVHDGIGRPLWQRTTDSLETGGRAVVVPAGPDTPLEQATVGAWRNRAFLVDAAANPLNVGAVVVGERGRVAGVVVSVAGGRNRVVPIGRACGRIRSCR